MSAPFGTTSLNLYREEGDLKQVASLVRPASFREEGDYRFTAYLDDPTWDLENPDHPSGLSEVLKNVTGLSIGFAGKGGRIPRETCD
ncbi:MAG: hypothetical protein ACO3VS_11945 [Limisphaerales bacterium]